MSAVANSIQNIQSKVICDCGLKLYICGQNFYMCGQKFYMCDQKLYMCGEKLYVRARKLYVRRENLYVRGVSYISAALVIYVRRLFFYYSIAKSVLSMCG